MSPPEPPRQPESRRQGQPHRQPEVGDPSARAFPPPLVSLPAAGVVVRPARPDDRAAGLVFDAARTTYTAAAGSEEQARAILARLWQLPGHSASFEHARVAEVDGQLAGVLIAFPARDRYRLHVGLLRRGLRYVPVRRWLGLIPAIAHLIAATPRPPRRAFYVGTIAVSLRARRRGVGSTLGYHAELIAAQRGLPVVVAHTGARHLPARRALERYGLRATKERSWGYVLYVKPVGEPPPPVVQRLRANIRPAGLARGSRSD